MIIKMVDEFKLTLVDFACCVCTWIYRWTKKCGKSGLGHRAFVLPDLQTAGPWAAGLLLAKHTCEMRKALLKLELILRNAILELVLKIRIIS